ncbi:MAG: hypothetical protein AAF658_20945 [Myxococcota bacterium]
MTLEVAPVPMERVREVLARIDELPRDATGVLRFSEHSAVLVESGRICWAAARGMQRRLTEVLCEEASPSIERRELEEILAHCRESGRPIGEALVASGRVSERSFERALFGQTVSAIEQLARLETAEPTFTPHFRARYDARFTFDSVDLLTEINARELDGRRDIAFTAFDSVLPKEAVGVGFALRERRPVAVVGPRSGTPRVAELVEICAWVSHVHELCQMSEPRAVILNFRGSGAVVTWRAETLCYFAICAKRSVAAVLISRLDGKGLS